MAAVRNTRPKLSGQCTTGTERRDNGQSPPDGSLNCACVDMAGAARAPPRPQPAKASAARQKRRMRLEATTRKPGADLSASTAGNPAQWSAWWCETQMSCKASTVSLAFSSPNKRTSCPHVPPPQSSKAEKPPTRKRMPLWPRFDVGLAPPVPKNNNSGSCRWLERKAPPARANSSTASTKRARRPHASHSSMVSLWSLAGQGNSGRPASKRTEGLK
mmetsp:Transcript_16844/g.48991  ORF Transcript_16844/g.48991 Transcript_16844/m.48991 type:complete len:217 (-) Transcript_16844:337-987(-)